MVEVCAAVLHAARDERLLIMALSSGREQGMPHVEARPAWKRQEAGARWLPSVGRSPWYKAYHRAAVGRPVSGLAESSAARGRVGLDAGSCPLAVRERTPRHGRD